MNAKKVKSFPSLTSYSRRFIEDYAKNVAHLYKLQKEGVLFEWDEKAQKAFETLRDACSKPVLKALNPTKSPILTNDQVITLSALF